MSAHPSGGLLRRFWIYQSERFPLVKFGPLLSLFAFSSVAFSRLSRGGEGFIPWPRMVVGAVTAVFLFFVLRVLDEHKDAEDDAAYRPELPVPRGLITLGELRGITFGTALVLLALNLWIGPRLLWALALVAFWASLMTVEFFVRDWLRSHMLAYLLTHMAIMPFIDVYTTGLDWLMAGARASHALVIFLAVTFFNGILVEIGRKIHVVDDEREGVDSYTKAWGLRLAPGAWLLALVASAALAAWAISSIVDLHAALPLIAVALLLCAIPAVRFLRAPTRERAQRIDLMSGLWPFFTYLLLGTGPYVLRWIRGG